MTKINDGGAIASAIERLRLITPEHDLWTGQDIADGSVNAKPTYIDFDIATILNAAINGELVLAARSGGQDDE